MSKVILVEGNISAGKSTLSRDLGVHMNYKVFFEPVVKNPYLEKYYKDPKAYALKMQMWLLAQRYETYCSAVEYAASTKGSGVLLDRSVFSDIVFAQKNYEDGNIDDLGYEMYLDKRKELLQNLPSPHAVVYLDVPAQVCHDRVLHMRQRECESGIPLEYLEGLERCYEDFLKRMEDEHQCQMIRKQWTNFGNVQEIGHDLRNVKVHRQIYSQTTWRSKTSSTASSASAQSAMDVFVLESKDDDLTAAPAGGISPMKC